jgi:hypothetical protein
MTQHAGLFPPKSGFYRGPVNARCVVDEVTLEIVYFFRVLRLSLGSIIPPMLHTHFHLNSNLLLGKVSEDRKLKQK